jgi:hypothetical protein
MREKTTKTQKSGICKYKCLNFGSTKFNGVEYIYLHVLVTKFNGVGYIYCFSKFYTLLVSQWIRDELWMLCCTKQGDLLPAIRLQNSALTKRIPP